MNKLKIKRIYLPYDEEDDVPVKKGKADDVYKRKALELEDKLRELQKSKKVEKEVHIPKGKALLE